MRMGDFTRGPWLGTDSGMGGDTKTMAATVLCGRYFGRATWQRRLRWREHSSRLESLIGKA